MNSWKVLNLSEFLKVVSEIEVLIGPRTVVLLRGPMAAGKTTFVQEFGRLRGVKEVSSPTFSLLQSYSSSKGEIHHLDLFRIRAKEELDSMGFWDLFSTQDCIFIEWPEKMDISEIPVSWKVYELQIIVPALKNSQGNSEARELRLSLKN